MLVKIAHCGQSTTCMTVSFLTSKHYDIEHIGFVGLW